MNLCVTTGVCGLMVCYSFCTTAYAEFMLKAETESAASRLVTLAVIADELETDIIENGVFRDVLDVGDGIDGNEERTAGRSPKDETLNALLRVLRELRLGKDSEGMTGNDLPAKIRAKNQFTALIHRKFGEKDELAWREGTPAIVHVDPEQLGDNHRRKPSPFPPGHGPDSFPDDLDAL